jgi:DNA polymerase III epsilon subunit-like protein
MCREKGRDILEVLDEFYEAYMVAESVIAHNIDFDENMVLIELHRNREAVLEKIPYCFTLFNKIYERMRGLEKYCTMKQGTELCAITVEGRVSKKWPKLAELHQRLFDEVPDGLHNSMVDVMATLRCYLKMRHHAAI